LKDSAVHKTKCKCPSCNPLLVHLNMGDGTWD
jgi:hypothetical protein